MNRELFTTQAVPRYPFTVIIGLWLPQSQQLFSWMLWILFSKLSVCLLHELVESPRNGKYLGGFYITVESKTIQFSLTSPLSLSLSLLYLWRLLRCFCTTSKSFRVCLSHCAFTSSKKSVKFLLLSKLLSLIWVQRI